MKSVFESNIFPEEKCKMSEDYLEASRASTMEPFCENS